MSRKDGETALGIWLRKAGRTLQPGQKKLLLDPSEPKGRPLHLKLAFEEARIWPSFADPKSIELESDIAGLIRANLFARLAAPENHGPIFIATHALGYLAASRYGLAEDELISVLSADQVVRNDFDARYRHPLEADQPLPVVVWSRLYFDLAPSVRRARC